MPNRLAFVRGRSGGILTFRTANLDRRKAVTAEKDNTDGWHFLLFLARRTVAVNAYSRKYKGTVSALLFAIFPRRGDDGTRSFRV